MPRSRFLSSHAASRSDAPREAIALAIDTVVHIGIDRSKRERHITQVLRVEGYNASEDKFITTPLYTSVN